MFRLRTKLFVYILVLRNIPLIYRLSPLPVSTVFGFFRGILMSCNLERQEYLC